MALIQRKTSEERAQRRAEQKADTQRRRAESDAQIQAQQEAQQREAFLATPAGRARTAFGRGDRLFQFALDVMNQQAIVVAMVGAKTSQTTADSTAVLNSVCREGWELVNASFVFVEQGQQSRDKFMSSGQNVAIRGTTVGYYLFRRCDENRDV